MHIPAWLPLAHLSLYPETQIGLWGRTLSKFHQLGIPTPLTLVIPVQTFKDIAEHNSLQEKVELIFQKYEVRTPEFDAEVVKLFSRIQIPKDFGRDFLKTYESLVGKSLVKVQLSPVSESPVAEALVHNCVVGETNVFDSLLHVWAAGFLITKDLFPGAIVIQQQAQPSSSGIAFTKDPETHVKTHMVVFSHWGAPNPEPRLSESDLFKVDVRTQNVIVSQPALKLKSFIREPETLRSSKVPDELQHQPSLTLAQLARLTHLIHTVKMHSLEHLAITWELVEGTFYLTSIRSLEVAEVTHSAAGHSAIIHGRTVIPGMVEGVTHIGVPTVPPHTLSSMTVLIVKQFTPQMSSYVPHVAAIISEQPLPAFAHQLLHHHQVPSIATARQATTHLSTGQSIVLDATNGTVTIKKVAPQPTTAPTLTKVWATASNPDQAQPTLALHADGIFFKGERLFAELGEHPIHLLRNARRPVFIKNALKALELYKPTHDYPLLYKSADMLTSDLLELSQARSFEQPEPNPYLGYRGSLRASHNFEVLDAELEVLTQLLSHSHRNLGLVIPFSRTPTELRLVISHIKHLPQPSLNKLELWWQISTPENIWHLHKYLTPQLTGIVLSIRDLHALAHGIDPTNPDVYARYPLNLQLIREMIGLAVSATHHQKILIQLDEEQQELVQLAAELKLPGVIMKPAHVTRARQAVLEIEHGHWK